MCMSSEYESLFSSPIKHKWISFVNMKLYSLIEILTAAHLSAFVESEQFPERSGIMLIAPPGNFKSTVIKKSYQPYMPQAMVLSDVNVETLNKLKNHMATGQVKTLALPALEKVYERNPQTAQNVEGHIKAMVDEGFSLASFQDHRMLGQVEARAMVCGGIVQSCYQQHFSKWDENGFVRRFVWSSFQLADPSVLTRAVHNWERIEFQNRLPVVPQGLIRMTCSDQESDEIRVLMAQQNCEATPYALMKKILCVLKWKFSAKSEKKIPMTIIRDFGTSLGQRMAKLEL